MASRGVGKLRTRLYKDSYKSSGAKGHDSASSRLGGVTLLRARQGGVQPYTTSINRVICGTHHRNPSAHSSSHPDAIRIHGMILHAVQSRDRMVLGIHEKRELISQPKSSVMPPADLRASIGVRTM